MKRKGKQIDKRSIVSEYLSSGLSMRKLAAKHGLHYNQIYKWTKAYKREQEEVVAPKDTKMRKASEVPVDVKKLQEELRKAQLHNKVLEAMIDISKEQYGIDLRKKPGARQS